MKFTYEAYRGLLVMLREHGYALRDYHNYADAPRCAILRHDIDYSLGQAVRLAELEAGEGIRSTWFVLLRTDFYNAASKVGQEALQHIRSLGHEIGLHFDEASYDPRLGPEDVVRAIGELREMNIPAERIRIAAEKYDFKVLARRLTEILEGEA